MEATRGRLELEAIFKSEGHQNLQNKRLYSNNGGLNYLENLKTQKPGPESVR